MTVREACSLAARVNHSGCFGLGHMWTNPAPGYEGWTCSVRNGNGVEVEVTAYPLSRAAFDRLMGQMASAGQPVKIGAVGRK